MLNQVIFVGRMTHDPEIKKLDDGRKVCDITIAVRRAFKNIDGEYDTDFIKISLWEGLAEVVSGYAEKGCLLAVKGRLQTRKYDLSDGKWMTVYEVVGERVTYLSPGKNKKNQEPRLDDEDFEP